MKATILDTHGINLIVIVFFLRLIADAPPGVRARDRDGVNLQEK